MDWLATETGHQHLVDGIVYNLNAMPECDSESQRLSIFAGVLNVLLSGMYAGVFETRVDRCADSVNCSDMVWKPIKKFTDNPEEQYYLAHKVAERIMHSLSCAATHVYVKERMLREIEEDEKGG